MRHAIGRLLIRTLALALLTWGAGMPLLALLGSTTEGEITHVRRQLGDRGEAIPNRYTYTISYQFHHPDGRTISGHSQRVGDYFSPKDMRVGKKVEVRYLAAFPWISQIEWSWGALIEYLLVGATGAALLLLTRRKQPLLPAGKAKPPRSKRHTD